jgi:antitoxin component YwqK of YwqJK toxin-antitoxin module
MVLTTRFLSFCVTGTVVVCLVGVSTRGDETTGLATDPFDETKSSQASVARSENAVTSSDEYAVGARRTELVTERYPDGSTKIQREVTLDDENDYVSHGKYTMYDRQGNVVRTGQYRMNKQHGEWTQFFRSDADLFSPDLIKQFSGPFVSVATFLDGQLHGTWAITSQDGKKVIEWNFDRGLRHGLATWWHPNGAKRWELEYANGVPVGERSIFGPDGQLTGTVTYIDGRPLVKKVKWYSKSRKEYEGTVLGSDEFDGKDFDWWNTSAIADTSTPRAPDVKHGAWTAWHPNGVKRADGSYDRGLPDGKFTWWTDNGQKQAEGSYQAGLKVGTWITWHDNGMKESQSNYRNDEYVGVWMRWEPTGRLVEMRDYDSNPAPRAAEAESDTQSEQQVGTETLEADEFEVSQSPSRLSQLWDDDADLE